MLPTVVHISFAFLALLILLVLMEVRKLGRRPEPVARLEEKVDRLSRQMEQATSPLDLQLPGGARIVEARKDFETITEQLERLGEAPGDEATLTDDGAARQLRQELRRLQADLAAARDALATTLASAEQAAETARAAHGALQHLEARLDRIADAVGDRS